MKSDEGKTMIPVILKAALLVGGETVLAVCELNRSIGNFFY